LIDNQIAKEIRNAIQESAPGWCRGQSSPVCAVVAVVLWLALRKR
jgi:hypothetical protein